MEGYLNERAKGEIRMLEDCGNYSSDQGWDFRFNTLVYDGIYHLTGSPDLGNRGPFTVTNYEMDMTLTFTFYPFADSTNC